MKQSGIVLIKSPHSGEQVLAVSNRKYGGWCLPGGKVDAGETPRDAAVRELYEETGLVTKPEDLVWLTKGVSATETGREVHMFFACRVVGWPRNIEPGTEFAWMTLAKLKETKPFGPFYTEHLPDGMRHLKSTLILSRP